MLKEYDFSRGVRGKYVRRFSTGTTAIVFDPDVARVFPDANSVNEVLRALEKLADEALEEHRAGKTKPLEPGKR